MLYGCVARSLYSGSVALMDMVLQLEASGMDLRKEVRKSKLCTQSEACTLL